MKCERAQYNWEEFRRVWTQRFQRIRLGHNASDKLKILGTAVLQSIPLTIRKKISRLDEKIKGTTEKLCRGTVVNIDSVRYVLLDYESFEVVSPEYYEESFIPIWFRPRRGEVLVDIGAHIGKYALSAAKNVGNGGMVVAIEPHPVNYKTLQRNVRLNKFENVVTLNLAAWDTDCKIKLFTGDVAGHHSAKINQGLGWVEVKARIMDRVLKELHLDRVGWIKIDVEGSEWEVLLGLKETITNYNPRIIIEVSYENLDNIKRFMKEHELGLVRISPFFEANVYFLCIPLSNELSHARERVCHNLSED